MSQQRKALWEADLDEDLQDVDLNLAIGTYGQNGLYEDGTFVKLSPTCCSLEHIRPLAQSRIDEATILAVQQQMAQQAAFAQIPDVVKRVSRQARISAIPLKFS